MTHATEAGSTECSRTGNPTHRLINYLNSTHAHDDLVLYSYCGLIVIVLAAQIILPN